ncbi:hypothetical protein [Pontibacter cellulosilyticus]|uniref:Uncharacterized protein n=1 Tax=Pontibacter cellulosilyticus TaxID=1720253 RepID=A0A923N7F9_9BACT|nr:hypothetical protein [Pontibacter cellulosilyticus]MBC5991880.1 hypothetical protein [Pontibacter cellulosilyticus]
MAASNWRDETPGTMVYTGLQYAGHEEQGPEEIRMCSGCMRGNDSYSNNGSASAGVYELEEKRSRNGYSNFISHNYGNIDQRQYTSQRGLDN